MAQYPKEHVRAGIVQAATSLFADVGFGATTMAAVAARAGTSIGNVYRYFESKEELFATALPTEFAAKVRAALGRAPGRRSNVLPLRASAAKAQTDS